MNQLLNGLLTILGAFLLLTLFVVFAPQVALYVCSVLGVLALIAVVRPFKPVWLGGRVVGIALLLLSAFSLVAAIQFNHLQFVELAAKNEARLQALKSSSPQAYLTELKSTGDSRWESELQSLDKPSYDALLVERRRNEEKARKEQIANLLGKLSKILSTDLEGLHSLYDGLSTLDPGNSDYLKKRDSLAKQIADANLKKSLDDQQTSHPENFVSIENYTWSKEGFGNVMEANFVIKNKLPWPVKDVEILCNHSAPSGTFIDSNRKTIYERFEANQTRRINKFNMGFIHSQAARTSCQIVSVISLR
jgi:hypothetical protein